jgi:hypothetical protein
MAHSGRVGKYMNLTGSVTKKKPRLVSGNNLKKNCTCSHGSQKYIHREINLAAVPSIVLPPPKTTRIGFPLREDKHWMTEAFASDTTMVFREGGERSK